MDSMQFKEDHHYIEQTRGGNLQAFALLVQKYEKLVFTLCYRMLKNREESQEAAQDSFIKVYQHLDHFQGNSKFSTWLYKISYNECLGRLRKKKIQFTLIEEITAEEDEQIHFQSGLEEMIREEREALIRNAIDQLSANEAAVITLFYLEELTVKEIASITSLSESNIKVVLHRGRKNLSHLIKKLSQKELAG